MGIFDGLNAEGMTIIMVTQNPDYAAYANRVLKVADGVLMEEPGESRSGRDAGHLMAEGGIDAFPDSGTCVTTLRLQ